MKKEVKKQKAKPAKKKPAKRIVPKKPKKRKLRVIEKATRVKLNKEIVHEINPNQAA